MYLDIDGAQGPFTLRVMTSGPGYRRWNIRISQIECANPSRAPPNCLQYFTGPSGMFQSFNYETLRTTQEALLIQQQQTGQNQYMRDATYFNNLDYAICFRKEVGFCTQTYQVNTTLVPMEINAQAPSTFYQFSFQSILFALPNLDAQPLFESKTYGGTGIQKCAMDYILLDGMRFCGARLSTMGLSTNAETDTPVFGEFVTYKRLLIRNSNLDRSSGPFIARFVSNERFVGRGFQIGFQQNPCGSRLPSPDSLLNQG